MKNNIGGKIHGSSLYMIKDNEEKRWCKVHVTSYWGKDQWGNFYERCSQGHRDNEKCEIGEQEHEKESNEI